MAFLEVKNVRVRGFSACVPKNKEANTEYSFFEGGEAEKFKATTGVGSRRVADKGTITSDLCFQAAEKLISDLAWDKNEIDCLAFVSHTPDYILPATSCILQSRLKLSNECYALDISLGCSGWAYGMSVVSSLLTSGGIKKALLLTGETTSLQSNRMDKTVHPLFGDAGTATALEFENGNVGLKFHFGTDGSGYKAIIIPEGGYRAPFASNSLDIVDHGSEGKRSNIDLYLNGMDVFSFGISRAPESVTKLCTHFAIDLAAIDYFVMHQANRFMNEKIRKKLKVAEEKSPYSIVNFGNTSSASIPLTIVTEIGSNAKNKQFVCCGFGVGLSWGSVYCELDNDVIISDLIEI